MPNSHTHCSKPASLDQFSEWSKEEKEMGKQSRQPLHRSAYQYHLSTVMALPELTLCLLMNSLFIQTFSYWQTNLAPTSASQPWDKSPESVWLMDSFLKTVASRISQTSTTSQCQLIIIILNIKRQCVPKMLKIGDHDKTITVCTHHEASEHSIITFSTLFQSNTAWPSFLIKIIMSRKDF